MHKRVVKSNLILKNETENKQILESKKILEVFQEHDSIISYILFYATKDEIKQMIDIKANLIDAYNFLLVYDHVETKCDCNGGFDVDEFVQSYLQSAQENDGLTYDEVDGMLSLLTIKTRMHGNKEVSRNRALYEKHLARTVIDSILHPKIKCDKDEIKSKLKDDERHMLPLEPTGTMSNEDLPF